MLAASAYFLAGKCGLLLAYVNPSVSPVWPPTGLALAMSILLGPQYWPAVFVGAFLVNVTTTGMTWTSLAIAAGNTLENVVAYYLIRRYADPLKIFDRVNSVLTFLLAVAVGTAVSASIGVATLSLGGLASSDQLSLWITWWLGDIGGAVVLTPIIVLLSLRGVRLAEKRLPEFFALIAFQILMAVIFWHHAVPGSYVHFLPVLWVAVRFRQRETMTVAFLLSCSTLFSTLSGRGPFSTAADPNRALLLLQGFLIMASVIGLVLSSAMRERRAAEASLEQKVKERTRQLTDAVEKDRANFQRLRSTIQSLPLAALITDENANLIELNEAYKNLALPDGHMDRIRAAMKKHEPILGQELHLKDGRIIVRDLLPIRDKDKVHGMLFLYRDVTKERRIDAAKSEFMSLASHQLRTPLTAIRWNLSRLKNKPESNGEDLTERLLAEAINASQGMAETIDTMLKISKIEAQDAKLDVATHAIADVLKNKATFFHPDIETKHQALDIDCPQDIMLSTDITFLREILRNLLQNAIKYTPTGGKISVRVRREDSAVVFEIKDNGYGIPAHQQKNVFQKFFRGDNVLSKDTGGSGLGLYLVSLLTKSLGGTVTMVSEENKGTTFTLTLPDLPVTS